MSGVVGMKRGVAMTPAERQAKYKAENRDKVNATARAWNAKNREKVRAGDRARHRRNRMLVLDHYGAFCHCCGEDAIEFLTVDHIKDDGADHRRNDKGSATIYRWLVKNNFPDGFQILSWNCNAAKQFRGGCPHQRFDAFHPAPG